MEKVEYELSFENTKRILERCSQINREIEKLLLDGNFDEDRNEITRRINDLLYETAKKQNMSLYDLCFHTIPKECASMEPSNFGVQSIEYTIRLMPVKFEFEKGPGYWKGKYYNLKRKMQEIIYNKEI